MKKLLFFLCLMPFLAIAQDENIPSSDPVSEKSKISYALGLDFGTYLKNLESEFDIEIISMAIRDAIAEKTTILNIEEANEAKKNFFRNLEQKRAEQLKQISEKNKLEEASFLEGNAKKPEVLTTNSGLQYSILRKGEGKTPQSTSKVKVHYRGTFLNGEEFDSSYKRGSPSTFPLNRVISAWTEGVQLMTEGSHYRFFAPSKMAYGEKGAPPRIPPNSCLIFEIELLEVDPKE